MKTKQDKKFEECAGRRLKRKNALHPPPQKKMRTERGAHWPSGGADTGRDRPARGFFSPEDGKMRPQKDAHRKRRRAQKKAARANETRAGQAGARRGHAPRRTRKHGKRPLNGSGEKGRPPSFKFCGRRVTAAVFSQSPQTGDRKPAAGKPVAGFRPETRKPPFEGVPLRGSPMIL